jgi:saccharopine dehydrogenase (NAD+, L-lysine forming)
MLKIGIIREGKVPPDARVPLNPNHCALAQKEFPVKIVVQPSAGRCFADEEYQQATIELTEDLQNCDVLMGVKEVPVNMLLPNKTYFFFSHTIKAQPYNRKLLQAVLANNIRLIDYEVLTDEQGQRLIAFGKFAGMVGAHNALWTYGQRSGIFKLKRMKDCHDYAEAMEMYKKTVFPPIKIVLTGSGRVGIGAAVVLRDMGIREVDPIEFLMEDFKEAVFTVLRSQDYAARKDKHHFDSSRFRSHPEEYLSIFEPYFQVADILINGIFWDNRAPAFFSAADMRRSDFRIRVIADITCDLAPISSIPSTLKASSIADPVFGYDPVSETECAPYQPHSIDMMTIDNLPNELPRDASTAFGSMFIRRILPAFFEAKSGVLERATIADKGQLTSRYAYLRSYVEGK